LISLGLIAFGIWIITAAAKAASGSLWVGTIIGAVPVVVGLFSFFSETQADKISSS
jgi:hypothetical protein